MAYKVEWTEQAWRDLEETAEYIAMDSPASAAVFIAKVKATAASLAVMPYRSRQVPEMEDTTIRELLMGNYRLVVFISEGVVFIVRIIHQSRMFSLG